MEETTVLEKPEFITGLENQLISGSDSDKEKILMELIKTGPTTLAETALDLIPIVCSCINQSESYSELDEYCEEILTNLAKVGNPKELLIGFLEQIEYYADTKFKILLKPTQIVLQRLPGKRGKSLEWVLGVLNNSVKKLQLPKFYNLEKEERKLLDFNPEIQRIVDILASVVKFYDCFVEEVSIKTIEKKDIIYKDRLCYQRESLTKSLLQFFHYPLAFLDLNHKKGDAKARIRIVAEDIIRYIKMLQSNFFKLFEISNKTRKNNTSEEEQNRKQMDDSAENGITLLSVATFFYLVLVEEVSVGYLPCVYSHTYVIELCLPCVNELLKSKDYAVHKGLLLGSCLCKKVPNQYFDVKVLDLSEHRLFAQNLLNVMIFNSVQEFRTVSVKLLQEYISKFDYEARYWILKCLLSSNEHAGVQGLLIQIFKNNLDETWQLNSLRSHFIGSNLRFVLQRIVPLPDGPATDLLEQSDRILSTLNFIRYLALRDGASNNLTGFWEEIEMIEEDLIKPLHKALDLSRAHYQLELKQQKLNEQTNTESKVELTIGNQLLPQMPTEQCFQILHSALNTFDMIDSVLVRVVELISLGKSCTK